MKNFNDTIGNRTRDLQACGAVPQPTAPPRAPILSIYETVLFLRYLYRRIAERPSSYRAVNTFLLGYKNLSVYVVGGTSRCLFSDKYKTHKYSVGREYNC